MLVQLRNTHKPQLGTHFGVTMPLTLGVTHA